MEGRRREPREAQVDLLERRAEHHEVNWDLSESGKINLCLKRAAATLTRQLAEASDRTVAPLLEVLRRSETLDASRLHAALAVLISATTAKGSPELDPDLCLGLLYSDRDPASQKPPTNEGFSVVLELDDPSKFDHPANHEVVWRAASQHLVAKQATPTQADDITPGKAISRRGIFDENLPPKIGSMPERTLPRVGKVKLFSLSHQTPCQARYGLIESDACPVGPEIQDRLSAALEWICREEREGQTWDDVSNSCGYSQPALLLAYPTKMPSGGPRLTEMFVRRSSDSEAINESRFETRARTVVRSLEGMIADGSDPTTISVMVIAKADTARKKLVYGGLFTAERMIAAAKSWQEAARNIPPIFIRAFEEGNPRWLRPLTPFPAEVVRVVNTCWASDGQRPKSVSNARIGLGLSLLLEPEHRVLIATREALRPLVRNVTPLVLAMARAHTQGRAFKGGPGDLPLIVPTVLGLLLAKMGHSKGEYMSSNAYLIGRFLGLADEFHLEYHRAVNRKKGPRGASDKLSPAQLIGNALMPTALENPVQALANAASRLVLYQREVDAKLRDRLGEVENAIDKSALPARCSDEDKAQMLLGYLARPQLEDRTDPTPVTDSNPKETES